MKNRWKLTVACILTLIFGVSYATVPKGTKFNFIVYDKKGQQFIAGGDNNILAVSKDVGKTWQYNSINPSSNTNGTSFDIEHISIDESGNIYLLSNLGNIFAASSADMDSWKFKQVGRDTASGSGGIMAKTGLIRIPESFQLIPGVGKLIFRTFDLVKLSGNSFQLIKTEFIRKNNETNLTATSSMMQTLNLGKNDKVTLNYADNAGVGNVYDYAVFIEVNDAVRYAYKALAGGTLTAYNVNSSGSTVVEHLGPANPLSGQAIFATHYESKGHALKVCPLGGVSNLLVCSDLSLINLGSVNGSDDDIFISEVVSSTEEASVVLSVADKSKSEIHLYHGSIDKHGVVEMVGQEVEFKVAPRTSVAGDGGTTAVMVGKDGNALVSTDGGATWVIKAM